MINDKEFDINEALAAQGFEPIGQQEEKQSNTSLPEGFDPNKMTFNMEASGKNNKVKYVKYEIKSEKVDINKLRAASGCLTSVAVQVIDNKAIDVLDLSQEHVVRRDHEKDLMRILSRAEKPLEKMASVMSMFVDDIKSSSITLSDEISFSMTPISAKEWTKLKSSRLKEDKQMDKMSEVHNERKAKRVEDPLEEKEKTLNRAERSTLGLHRSAIKKGKIDEQELKDEVRARTYYHMSYQKLKEIRENKR
ncbi:MAG: hypothetical protein IJ660_06215 [Alphaproteobacteria bacterium]|nr:hypothetical protein [Alphaproteobacteria bacterium]